MRKLKEAWQHFFDIRPGEYRRTIFMSLYLLFILFSYYVLKSASESMFLNKFDIDKLPTFYIAMAVFGGILAYVYTRIAARTSIHMAVTLTMFASVAFMILVWFPLRTRNAAVIYVFAVWVRLYSIVTVTQGWVVATNLFNSREAKRVYGTLTLGMVLGAMFGGAFTNFTVRHIGTNNLLFASAPLALAAYGCYLIASGTLRTSLASARADTEEHFSFTDIGKDIGRSKHLQALITIMAMQFIVDTLIDYQFKAMAKATYRGDALTAFFGRFQGLYLNVTELILQLLFTTAVVKRIGVGGTMQVMPVSLAVASMFTVGIPSLLTASIARLTEASTRYTLARTANELFYMPLPLEMRNRVKAFIDIFMDRAARGISGVVLLFIGQLGVRGVALVTIGVTIPWILLTIRAHREYVRTIRRRLESRRLDLESLRVTVEDREAIHMLERTAESPNPRQASYALGLLNDAPKYDLRPILIRLAASPQDEVRAKVFELARGRKMPDLRENAEEELRRGADHGSVRQAVMYLVETAQDPAKEAKKYLDRGEPALQEGAIEALIVHPEVAREVIHHEWINAKAADEDWRQRALAARVVAIRGDQGTEVIHKLLADPDRRVAEAAASAAGMLRNRAYVFGLAKLLANYRTRGAAIHGLAAYGPAICGTLGDMLADEKLPLSIRANLPRVLRRIPHQRSVDVLMSVYRESDPQIRDAVLTALSRLRQAAPGLNYEDPLLTQQILNEVNRYYELAAIAEPLAQYRERPRSAISLLNRTLDVRMKQTLQRVFNLLALRYPAGEMRSAYLALTQTDKDRHTAAIDLLDNVLSQDLKRVLLPAIETPQQTAEHGRDLFNIERYDAESAIGKLLDSGEPWLMACAIAAAAELRMHGLSAVIRQAGRDTAPEVRQVAESALQTLG